MPYKTKEERNAYAKKYYHKQMQKERELKEQLNPTKQTEPFQPILDKESYRKEHMERLLKFVLYFFPNSDAIEIVKENAKKFNFDIDNNDEAYFYLQMLEARMQKLYEDND
jgi:hypothetical protein